jgi:hypothetical protein
MPWLVRFIIARFGMRILRWGWRRFNQRRVTAPPFAPYDRRTPHSRYQPGPRQRMW